jgi:mono/diheme cytochrome c family protein
MIRPSMSCASGLRQEEVSVVKSNRSRALLPVTALACATALLPVIARNLRAQQGEGWAAYDRACSTCHGPDAKGSAGP